MRNYEGVVALKILTNNLLAVIYSNGLLRVIQVSDFSIVMQTNVLADRELLEKIGSSRLVEAKIASKTHLSVPSTD